MQDRLLPQVALYTTGLMHIMLLFVGDRFGKVGRRSLGSSRDVILRVIERGVEENGKGYNRTDRGILTTEVVTVLYCNNGRNKSE